MINIGDTDARVTPDDVAEELRVAPQAAVNAVSSADVALSLGPDTRGWFTLYWTAAKPGTYDWIGLYQSESAPDTDYIGGNNWQWATRGATERLAEGESSGEHHYVTSTPVNALGYQARYLIWDANAKVYRSILRTPPYPGKVCSS